jgi:hypothetical protein
VAVEAHLENILFDWLIFLFRKEPRKQKKSHQIKPVSFV